MKIRKANLKDLSVLAKYQVDMAMESEGMVLCLDTVTKGINAAIESPDTKGQIWVAEKHDGEIAGTLMITYEWSDWRNGWIWWIESVYVTPNERKNGVFKMLYTHIQNIVSKDDELKGIRLYVDKTNIRAQKVYDAIGMCGEHYTTYEWMKC